MRNLRAKPKGKKSPVPTNPHGQTAWERRAAFVTLTPLAYHGSKWVFENPTVAPIAAGVLAAAIVFGVGVWLGRVIQHQ